MNYVEAQRQLLAQPKRWLITGVAGFIGSNILEQLLRLGQVVVGMDNFATGHHHNLLDVEGCVSTDHWRNFTFRHGDICNYADCEGAVDGIHYVLHQAALGSVPRSIDDPISTNASNVTGFLNMLEASRGAKVESFTYAASSSTYGDNRNLPKLEDEIGKPLSPYAATKLANEIYADVYARTFGFKTIGLRYFNVFGPRQDPNGAYAAVIPKWMRALIESTEVTVNGDGYTSRDFCYIANTVQMNILSAIAEDKAKNQIYNVALGDRTTLLELIHLIESALIKRGFENRSSIVHQDFRPGDVMHSQANINKARQLLEYKPSHTVSEGIEEAVDWYLSLLNNDIK